MNRNRLIHWLHLNKINCGTASEPAATAIWAASAPRRLKAPRPESGACPPIRVQSKYQMARAGGWTGAAYCGSRTRAVHRLSMSALYARCAYVHVRYLMAS